MLGEFKSEQIFVEKAKLANNFYVENLNHLSWNNYPINYVQLGVSKITKENNNFKFGQFIDIARILKWSLVSWKKNKNSQTIWMHIIRLEILLYIQLL